MTLMRGSLALALFMACTSSQTHGPVRDLNFAISGVVSTEAGAPVSRAEVTLYLLDVTPPSEIKSTTNDAGAYRFDAFVGRKPIPFAIVVEAQGFSSERVTGSWPADEQSQSGTVWLGEVVRNITLKAK